MLNKIAYTVTFPITGRTLAREVAFEAGTSAITGPNEAGKSMVIEMVRFCLFGTEALRGNADDYKTLRGALWFTVRGERYRVERTIGGAKLYNGELLATGVRPVNARIQAILGFGLEVFDVACVANQGDVEKLAKMRPTERKKMVDEVIGANRIEELAKWCGEEALLLSREIAALERELVEPRAPVEPEGYVASADLDQQVLTVREKQRELSHLTGWLQNRPTQPQEPLAPLFHHSEPALMEAERLLQLTVHDFDIEAVKQAWEAYDSWEERQRFDRANPRATLTKAEALDLIAYRDVTAELDRLRKSPVLTCPCGKPFTTADARIAELEAQRVGLAVVKGIYDPMEELRRISLWENPETLSYWERVKDAQAVPCPSVSRQDVVRAEAGIRRQTRDDLLAGLGLPPETTLEAVRDMLRCLRTYAALKAAYGPLKAAYDAWVAKAEGVAAQVQALVAEVAALPDLERRLWEARAYEAALLRYQQDRALWETRVAELETKKAERRSWIDGKAGFNELRDRVKTYLVPSLSRVASALLSQMTGGARNAIVVNEDFEVWVDGQPLATLSGSGKACANLALRIGLGQVLTNNQFSLFIGDEIDASMDEDRARNLQMSLVNIRDRISQIIIVTHKVPQAEHVVSF